MSEPCIILHVEDNDADHVLFLRDLKKLHFTGEYRRVESFAQAQEYLENAARGEAAMHDLVIADSRLGVYSGLDIVRWIKEKAELRNVPLVVYSTAVSPHQAREILAAGAAACLTKPIDSAETLVALEIILGYVDQSRQCRS
jgi:CheY-like chemotaxis protein